MQKFYLHINLPQKLSINVETLGYFHDITMTFSWKEKFSVCFFSFRSSHRKVYFTLLTVAKTGFGLGSLRKLSKIVK